jgi:hypothetical protein
MLENFQRLDTRCLFDLIMRQFCLNFTPLDIA